MPSDMLKKTIRDPSRATTAGLNDPRAIAVDVRGNAHIVVTATTPFSWSSSPFPDHYRWGERTIEGDLPSITQLMDIFPPSMFSAIRLASDLHLFPSL
jgi:hypothetical protein